MRLLPAAGIGLVALAAVTVPASSAHAGLSNYMLYITPTGGDSTGNCLQSTPCSLTAAFGAAPYGATLLIEPGAYYQSNPLTEELNDNNRDLVITGPATGPAPMIYTAASTGSDDGIFLRGSTLSHVTIIYTGDNTALLATASSSYPYTAPSVSHVAVFASNGDACAVFGTLSDSVCVTTADGGYSAVGLSSGAGGPDRDVETPSLHGVTAIATGAGDYGVSADAGAYTEIDVSLTNVIAKGAQADVHTNQEGTGSGNAAPLVKVTASHSDFNTELAELNNTTILPKLTITTDATDLKAAPKLKGDLTEAPGSPTINKGAKATGTDLAGNPRTLGPAPDIGAYEFRQKPALHGLKITGSTATKLAGKVTVNGEGLVSKIQVRVTRGKHTVKVLKLRKHVVRSATVHFKLRRLAPGTRYRIQASAHNAGGTTKTLKHTVRTKP